MSPLAIQYVQINGYRSRLGQKLVAAFTTLPRSLIIAALRMQLNDNDEYWRLWRPTRPRNWLEELANAHGLNTGISHGTAGAGNTCSNNDKTLVLLAEARIDVHPVGDCGQQYTYVFNLDMATLVFTKYDFKWKIFRIVPDRIHTYDISNLSHWSNYKDNFTEPAPPQPAPPQSFCGAVRRTTETCSTRM